MAAQRPRKPRPPARPSASSPTSRTIENLAVAYIETRTRQQRFRGQTPRTVRSVLFNFAESVGPNRAASSLTRRHVENWADSLTLSTSTRKHRISTVRAFCAWLAAEDHIRADPARSLSAPRLPRSIPRGLEHPAVSSLYQSLPDTRAALIISLMVQEGLRCKEVAGIELGDINRRERQLLVREGKGGHQRVLALSDETHMALAAYLNEHPASHGPLIRRLNPRVHAKSTHHGMTPGSISKLVSRWMSDAEIKTGPRDGVSAHALRHTMATDMLKSGAHLVDVQAALGHASLSTTQIYLPWTLGDLRKAMGGRAYRHPSTQPESPPAA